RNANLPLGASGRSRTTEIVWIEIQDRVHLDSRRTGNCGQRTATGHHHGVVGQRRARSDLESVLLRLLRDQRGRYELWYVVLGLARQEADLGQREDRTVAARAPERARMARESASNPGG